MPFENTSPESVAPGSSSGSEPIRDQDELIAEYDRIDDRWQFIQRFRGTFGCAVGSLSERNKSQLGDIVSRWLRTLLPDGPARPESLRAENSDQHLQFWNLLHLLRQCNERAFDDHHARHIGALATRTFTMLREQTGQALDGSHTYVNTVYELMSIPVSDAFVAACEQELRRADLQVRSSARRNVTEHCSRWLQDSRKFIEAANGRLDVFEQIAAFLEADATPLGRPRHGIAEMRRVFGEWRLSPNMQRHNGRRAFRVRQAGQPDSLWELSFFASDAGDGGCLTARRVGSDALITVTLTDFCDRMRRQGANFFASLAAEGNANQEREENGRKALSQFDLPRAGSIAHLRVFPRRYDRVIGAMLQTSMLLSGALRARYGERMQIRPMIFSDNPREEMLQSVREAHQAGTRCFCIDLFSHGNRNRGLETFRPPITARDLASLANQFPDSTFNFSSMACFGGGLREGMMDEFERDDLITAFETDTSDPRTPLRNRANLFVQSRPNTINHTALREGTTRPFDTYATQYYLTFIRSLHEGRSFGEAAAAATRETRQSSMLHPETIINGRLVLGPRMTDDHTTGA